MDLPARNIKGREATAHGVEHRGRAADEHISIRDVWDVVAQRGDAELIGVVVADVGARKDSHVDSDAIGDRMQLIAEHDVLVARGRGRAG